MVIFQFIGTLIELIIEFIPIAILTIVMGYLFAFIVEFLIYRFW